jgi:hypothetical protein
MKIHINRITYHAIFAFIVLGIFLPSSIGGVAFGKGIYYILNAIISLLLVSLSFKRLNATRSILTFFLLLFLAINTFFTSMQHYQPGILLIIMPLLFYFSIDTKNINVHYTVKYLNIISIILFILAIGVVFDIDSIEHFLSSLYVTKFTDLYKYMMAAHRPVGPFGSHSIAAFVYFVFFTLYYILWLQYKRILYLIFAFTYIAMIFALHSFSALFFIIFAIMVLLNSNLLLKKINIKFFIFNLGITVFAFLVLNSFVDVIGLLSGTDTNGLISRYGSNGILVNNIHHLKEYLLMGDGLGYDPSLTYTDSGYMHNLLLYGLSGTVIFYILFTINLFKKNLTYIFFIYISFLFFEIGYDIFFYARTLYILLIIDFFIKEKCQ